MFLTKSNAGHASACVKTGDDDIIVYQCIMYIHIVHCSTSTVSKSISKRFPSQASMFETVMSV